MPGRQQKTPSPGRGESAGVLPWYHPHCLLPDALSGEEGHSVQVRVHTLVRLTVNDAGQAYCAAQVYSGAFCGFSVGDSGGILKLRVHIRFPPVPDSLDDVRNSTRLRQRLLYLYDCDYIMVRAGCQDFCS